MQCSNIFLTKEQDVRLGEYKEFIWFPNLDNIALADNLLKIKILGDFGLAKMLIEEDLASSVRNCVHNSIFSYILLENEMSYVIAKVIPLLKNGHLECPLYIE